MRLLLYSWNANNEQILADNLKQIGFELVIYDKPCRHYTRDLELASDMIPFIHAQNVEAVISFNYFPIISMICDTCKIPYYAWVYDCPHFTLYAKQIALPCNHISIFDREMVKKLRSKGVQTVCHLPLAVDTDHFAKKIQGARRRETESFQSDISFVGSLYTDEHNYYDRLLDEKDKEILDELIRRQCFCYNDDLLGKALATGEMDLHMIQVKMEEQGLMLGEDYFADVDELLKASVLEKKVTVEERSILLHNIAETYGDKYRFHLYTGSDLQRYPTLKRCHRGIVDYHKQMPLVFAQSKINLNVSLRSIHSGIPLRVLDIMACGGFVLTNRQPEILEYFENGREIVTFGSMEECLDKIAYYLEHEEERQKIAAMGQLIVRDKFGYEKGLMKLFGLEE